MNLHIPIYTGCFIPIPTHTWNKECVRMHVIVQWSDLYILILWYVFTFGRNSNPTHNLRSHIQAHVKYTYVWLVCDVPPSRNASYIHKPLLLGKMCSSRKVSARHTQPAWQDAYPTSAALPEGLPWSPHPETVPSWSVASWDFWNVSVVIAHEYSPKNRFKFGQASRKHRTRS